MAGSRFVSASFAAAMISAALSALAPSAAQTSGSDLIITGRRAEQMAFEYTAAVAVAPEDQYARWNNRLCPSVAGLAQAEAQTLIDHIALRAHDVGLRVGEPGCQRNLVIIFAPDSDRLAREIVDTRRDLLGYHDQQTVSTAGREALDDFVGTPRAVRWWHVANRVSADGRPLADTESQQGVGARAASAAAMGDMEAAVRMGSGFEGVEAVRSQGTRFRATTRRDLGFALIVVDTRRVEGLPPQAVADYLAMAALVQLDPRADMRAFPTVLNLFADQAGERPPVVGMTAWDRAYLQGLYAATREAASSRQQRSEIARRIVRDVTR